MKPTDYAQLSRPFDHVFRDKRGGASFDYFTGEQCVSRLMEQGPGFASFEIMEHGINDDADEVWVLGKLTCRVVEINPAHDPEMPIDDIPEFIVVPTVMMQFGSQKIKRSRSSRQPLDIGFDLKGAATDAYKKCAAQGVGVGLYLWAKAGGIATAPPDDGVPEESEYVETDAAPEGARQCSARITPEETCDQTVPAGEPVMAAMREFNRPLCAEHLRIAREHVAAAEAKRLEDERTAAQTPLEDPESPLAALSGPEAAETPESTDIGSEDTGDDPDVRIINGRSVRARTCDAKDRGTQTECGYKLWPGTHEVYGTDQFSVSVLISESISKYHRVLCPEHFVKMNQYTAKQAGG